MVEQLAVITTIATNPHDGKGSSADALKKQRKERLIWHSKAQSSNDYSLYSLSRNSPSSLAVMMH